MNQISKEFACLGLIALGCCVCARPGVAADAAKDNVSVLTLSGATLTVSGASKRFQAAYSRPVGSFVFAGQVGAPLSEDTGQAALASSSGVPSGFTGKLSIAYSGSAAAANREFELLHLETMTVAELNRFSADCLAQHPPADCTAVTGNENFDAFVSRKYPAQELERRRIGKFGGGVFAASRQKSLQDFGVEFVVAMDQVKAVLASDVAAKATTFDKNDFQLDGRLTHHTGIGSFTVRAGWEGQRSVDPKKQSLCIPSGSGGNLLCSDVAVLKQSPQFQQSWHMRFNYTKVWFSEGKAANPGIELGMNADNLTLGANGTLRALAFVTPDFSGDSGTFQSRFRVSLDVPLVLHEFSDDDGAHKVGDLQTPSVFGFAGTTF